MCESFPLILSLNLIIVIYRMSVCVSVCVSVSVYVCLTNPPPKYLPCLPVPMAQTVPASYVLHLAPPHTPSWGETHWP